MTDTTVPNRADVKADDALIDAANSGDARAERVLRDLFDAAARSLR